MIPIKGSGFMNQGSGLDVREILSPLAVTFLAWHGDCNVARV